MHIMLAESKIKQSSNQFCNGIHAIKISVSRLVHMEILTSIIIVERVPNPSLVTKRKSNLLGS